MKLLGGTRPSTDTCPSTSLCIKTCKHDLKLGPKGSDGCPSCACVKSGNCIISNKKTKFSIVILENQKSEKVKQKKKTNKTKHKNTPLTRSINQQWGQSEKEEEIHKIIRSIYMHISIIIISFILTLNKTRVIYFHSILLKIFEFSSIQCSIILLSEHFPLFVLKYRLC